jgi:hypothetical protein
MPETEVEKEYEEIKGRRNGGMGQVIKNITPFQFIVILFLALLFLWFVMGSSTNRQAIMVGFAIILFIFFFQKKAESSGLISEEVAKRIAYRAVENKKEDFHIEPDSEVTPTNYCVLQYRSSEPLKWHVGMKVENRVGRIEYWRVIIHPYDGIVIGIVKEPTGFEGNEHEVNDIVVVYPDHFTKE